MLIYLRQLNKKGNVIKSLSDETIMLLIVALVFLVLFSFVKSNLSGTGLKERLIAQDIGKSIVVIGEIKEDLEFFYIVKLDTKIVISDSFVKVGDTINTIENNLAIKSFENEFEDGEGLIIVKKEGVIEVQKI
ncbi:MAG: hypothetical protein HYS32_01600 [Candidatus Woesearchaeota archaeon]|nr:MAG: hypothetical protein HYS32_01600 [Candidatus Woesearchaeota archaeon]